MAQPHSSAGTISEITDPGWKDLYRIGGIISFIGVGINLFAIMAFFIWPYKPGFTSTVNILTTLQNDRLGGLMALDVVILVGTLLYSLPLLALYVALKRVNESYALIALFLGAIAIVALIPARPISELVLLSNQYATAATEVLKSRYLAAGEALLALFSGTAWLVNVIFSSLSSLISSLLMLRSNIFSKATAYVGIISNLAALGFFIPGVGILLLFIATLGAPLLQFLIGRGLLRLAQGKPTAA